MTGFGFETRPCAGCGRDVSTLAGFGSVALCSFCGSGPDADHGVSAALERRDAPPPDDPTGTPPAGREPVQASRKSRPRDKGAGSAPSTGVSRIDLGRFGVGRQL